MVPLHKIHSIMKTFLFLFSTERCILTRIMDKHFYVKKSIGIIPQGRTKEEAGVTLFETKKR